MIKRRITGPLVAAILMAGPALADLRGPAELPPAGYKGQQYVDSKGCVFLRGGLGGTTAWVPRISRDRKQLCNAPPSGQRVQVAEAQQKPAPLDQGPPLSGVKVRPGVAPSPAPLAPAPKVQMRLVVVAPPPPVVVAAAPVRAPAAPAAVKPPIQATAPVRLAEGSGYRLACPAESPIAQRFDLHGGGSKILCTKADGAIRDLTLPRLVAGDLNGVAQGYDAYGAKGAPQSPGATALPKGYKSAWKDGRLNPERGPRTAQGNAAQDQIWTKEVPAQAKAPAGEKVTVTVRGRDGAQVQREARVTGTHADGRRKVVLVDGAGQNAPQTYASSKNYAPATGYRVQVGSFGVSENAARATAKLAAMGLPVSHGRAQKGKLTVVSAGPFADAAAAQAALKRLRAEGFGDAVLAR